MTNKEIEQYVSDYRTKYEEGFTGGEILELMSIFTEMNTGKFNESLMGNTGIVRGSEFITYRHDIATALKCGLQNRDMYGNEFD